MIYCFQVNCHTFCLAPNASGTFWLSGASQALINDQLIKSALSILLINIVVGLYG